MSEVFRELRPAVESLSVADSGSDESNVTSDTSYAIHKETDAISEFESNLEAWETEGKKKYVNEYFDTHQSAQEDFSTKMATGMIDKFVRSELEERGLDKTIDNYKKTLEAIEKEIGSDKLEKFERFKKLTGYIKAMQRLRDSKKRVGAFKSDVDA